MRFKITSMLTFGCLLLFTACSGGGGSDSSSNAAEPADFIMELPIDTTQYVNSDDPNDMAWYDLLLPKKAYADNILQVPPMANNIIQDWWTGDCATLYDEADSDNIRLLPLIGDRKKLVVGEQYQLIVEADRLNQFNQCGFGYAVTGGWSFNIASVTVGEIADNVVIVDQYETGELVIEILDNATDYSTPPVVTINFVGVDYNGPISGSAEFEITKDPLQIPHANRLQFAEKEVKYRQKTHVIVAELPEQLNIRVIGPHIAKSSWISNMGALSSGQLDSDTWTWMTPTTYKEVIGFLVTMENDDNVISQRKFILYDETGSD